MQTKVEEAISLPVSLRYAAVYGSLAADSAGDGEKKRAAEFQLAEYKEAANAYFKGVDIGYTGIRGYITINALFATALGLLAGPKGQSTIEINKVALISFDDIIRLLPVFPLFAAAGFFLTFLHYFKHLKNCQSRCAEIEGERGGELFVRLGQIAYNPYKIGAVVGAFLITIPIALFWAFLAARLRSFEYVWEFLRPIFS